MSLTERARRIGQGAVLVTCRDPLSRSSVHGLDRQVSEARQVCEVLSASRAVILIDLRSVSRIDNDALTELCVMLRRFSGSSLRIVGADGRVRAVLQVCAIDGLEFAPWLKWSLARARARLARRLRSIRRRAGREPDMHRSPSRPLS